MSARINLTVEKDPIISISSDNVIFVDGPPQPDIEPWGDPDDPSAYIIKPTIIGGLYATKGKYMLDDLTILPIPKMEVGNASGGLTVSIGS